ncbi:MAG: DUF2062 domain-containing protein [Bacteroidales bacterium]|nr:DUF2062 domain-containing protein [Bacteroidales bacterium]MCF8458644.1 DUF2062 domain-containing protein [Bacteroidales bacterium]
MAEVGQHQERFSKLKCCVIVPTYNNASTIAEVLKGIQDYTENIIVVNDGSTDNTTNILKEFEYIEVTGYGQNQGKGYAIRTGFKHALKLGFEYAITIDSDGQHYPDDLPSFLDKLEDYKNAILVGSRNLDQENMPGKNSFGNKFSNFWFKVETGMSLPDTQSGYRLYPIKHLKKVRFFTRKYEFEIEVMVRAAWKGIEILPIPVKVYYAPGDERISHFRPFVDFFRISVLNTVLVTIALLYIKPRDLFRYLQKEKVRDVIRKHILKSKEPTGKIASALGFGILMGIVPIWGFQTIVAIFLAHLFKLNKALVVIAANISIPPILPFILYFSYLTGSLVLNKPSDPAILETFKNSASNLMDGKFAKVMDDMGYSFMQYLVGSIIFAIAMAFFTFILSYLLIVLFRKKRVSDQDV